MKKQPYGGISNITKYFMEQYGQRGVLVKRGKSIVMNQQSMETISGRRTRNCSVVAVTRVLDYYRRTKQFPGVPEDIKETYKVVEEIAESYGYTDKFGTMPFFISGITKEAFAKDGVKAKCGGV